MWGEVARACRGTERAAGALLERVFDIGVRVVVRHGGSPWLPVCSSSPGRVRSILRMCLNAFRFIVLSAFRRCSPKVSSGECIGPLAKRFWETLTDIQYGRVEHPWSVRIS